MVAWAIRKMFEKFPNETISLYELKKQLELAWDELVEEGSVILYEDKEVGNE